MGQQITLAEMKKLRDLVAAGLRAANAESNAGTHRLIKHTDMRTIWWTFFKNLEKVGAQDQHCPSKLRHAHPACRTKACFGLSAHCRWRGASGGARFWKTWVTSLRIGRSSVRWEPSQPRPKAQHPHEANAGATFAPAPRTRARTLNAHEHARRSRHCCPTRLLRRSSRRTWSERMRAPSLWRKCGWPSLRAQTS